MSGLQRDRDSGRRESGDGGEAQGSGSESGHFPDKPDETMQRLTGNKEPLSNAIVEGDTGYFSEHNLKAAKQRGIEVILPDRQFRKRDAQFAGRKCHGGKCRFTAEDFVYTEGKNSCTYPGPGKVEPNRNSGEKYQARGVQVAGPVHSQTGREDPEADAVYNGALEGRESRWRDTEEDRPREVSGRYTGGGSG
jgi:hypothetical protein